MTNINLLQLALSSEGWDAAFSNWSVFSWTACRCGRPAWELTVILWPGWRWPPVGWEWKLSCKLGAETSLEPVCCGMNCLVISSGTELPHWHVHPAASNANEQILRRLNEMFQRVIKAAFWESENKLSSSLCKKKAQFVNVCTFCLYVHPSLTRCSVVADLEVFNGLGRQLRGSQWWIGLEFVHWDHFVNMTPRAYPIAWQWKYGSLENMSRF